MTATPDRPTVGVCVMKTGDECRKGKKRPLMNTRRAEGSETFILHLPSHDDHPKKEDGADDGETKRGSPTLAWRANIG